MTVLFDYPKKALFGRVLPKNKIYEYAGPSTAMKELFVRQVDQIVWKYKLAPETINISATQAVPEIQIFAVSLKTGELKEDVLRCIDKAIPFPIIYEVSHAGKCRAVAAYNFQNIAAPLDEEQRSVYKNKDNKYEIRGGYITQPLATNSKDDRPNLRYSIFHEGVEIKPDKQWIWSEDRFKKAYANDEIVINEKEGKYSVRSKQYLRDENGVERLGKPISFLNGPFNQDGTKEIKELFDRPVFGFPKPTKLLEYFLSFVVNESDDKDFIALDFFAGSCSTAQALMQLNAQDGGNRKFILVQFPEDTDRESEAFKAGYKNIAEVGKERIRRAGKKVSEGNCHVNWNKDIGFRVLKTDSSNMADIHYVPDAVKQTDLLKAVENIKPDRNNSEDLLFQVLLDWGVDLTLPIRKEKIQGKQVFFVDDNALTACFDTGITEELVKELASRKPLRVVFRDNGFTSDAVKINVDQIFKQLSPGTDVKSI